MKRATCLVPIALALMAAGGCSSGSSHGGGTPPPVDAGPTLMPGEGAQVCARLWIPERELAVLVANGQFGTPVGTDAPGHCPDFGASTNLVEPEDHCAGVKVPDPRGRVPAACDEAVPTVGKPSFGYYSVAPAFVCETPHRSVSLQIPASHRKFGIA